VRERSLMSSLTMALQPDPWPRSGCVDEDSAGPVAADLRVRHQIMSRGDYDDRKVLREYLDRYWSHYATPAERECYWLGIRCAKAQRSLDPAWREEVRASLEQADDWMRDALKRGVGPFWDRTRKRVLLEFRQGRLQPNRCPECRRIARTPEARQCRWCGHDWHHA
jgi:hypothetical protein